MATLTDSGLAYFPRVIGGLSAAPFTFVALGTDDTVEANADAALGNEVITADAVGGVRKVADTIEYEADNKLNLVVTFTFSGTVGVNEMGVFDVVTEEGGHMCMRHVFSAVKNFTTGQTFQLTIPLTVSRT